MALFERHLQKMLCKFPKDGATVDLAPLFYSMTMDSATEFLFGTSSDSQGTDTSVFTESFEACQDWSLFTVRFGKFAPWLPRPKSFKQGLKVVYDFVDKYVDEAVDRHD